MALHLYDYFRSSAGYRVRIALNLKGVAYTREKVTLTEGEQRSPAHLARHPQGLVPALDADGVMLTQSYAIIDWLDRRWPEPRLIPDDAVRRARSIGMAMTIGADIHPLNNLRVLRRLETELGQPKPVRDAWYAHWIVEGFGALETLAGDGPFLGGAAPDIADLFLVPQMFNARRFAVDVSAYPRLVAADAAANALSAFAAAHPDRVGPQA